jgi:hypothetical protein
MLLAAFYGSLALLALWATWRERDLRWVGIALVFSWSASNAIWFLGGAESRPGVYTMCEVFVAIAAYMAWDDLRYRMLPVLVLICALSTAANVALALQLAPIRTQIHTHEVITNICFALECGVAFGMGVWHGVTSGRFDSWPGVRNMAGHSHALRDREP